MTPLPCPCGRCLVCAPCLSRPQMRALVRDCPNCRGRIHWSRLRCPEGSREGGGGGSVGAGAMLTSGRGDIAASGRPHPQPPSPPPPPPPLPPPQAAPQAGRGRDARAEPAAPSAPRVSPPPPPPSPPPAPPLPPTRGADHDGHDPHTHPSPPLPRSPRSPQEGGWVCPQCTFANAPSEFGDEGCSQCKAWSCGDCTFIHTNALLSKCDMCHVDRVSVVARRQLGRRWRK